MQMASRTCIRSSAFPSRPVHRHNSATRHFSVSSLLRAQEEKPRRGLSKATGPRDIAKLQQQADAIERQREKDYAKLWTAIRASDSGRSDDGRARATTKRLQAEMAYLHASQRFEQAAMA
ncbi:hypothetical protein CLAFUW4_13381 [Fulvia fulva]|uniref:Uncharacterized protein n=1 Tax=Passalora fulva TaxID=5499 RepID=A0A9Q8PK65_PASFU|nr:uncharacterized protein CLAFUR5_13234 [Fulvia fulva]KAK4611969.1 hypothetical protein CLAFUR4_13385 [Fulvia fulva]KAK4613201.1 hypothetical protein CLAFUR0_13391 [Fulvia fulva]UJO23941.1 hypothetical protein CLAFUR5_13234 [Fulvia fulva]WPV21201.1 hypothetical protein CLAFUW4_13381 [Fulvia fulva]WPV36320.1 hypothetical protein CLAFUW7_13388 [Fulvia fulva]